MTIMEPSIDVFRRPASSLERPTEPVFNRKSAWLATIVIFAGAMVLIFTHLGHYPLWDDEAITAMTGRGVWRTGDTSAWADAHNLVAYRNGLLINHFADRFTPPLQFYILGLFMGLFGESSFVCRLPFAICGVVAVCVILRWLWRAKPSPLIWWAAAFIILTNAEFFLFQRQCRYYGLSMMLSVVAVYLYHNWNNGRKSIWPLSIALACLLTAQYLNYAALVGCLMVDYGIWGRKRRVIQRREWLAVILPQLIVGGIVCSIWNPIQRAAIAATTVTTTTAAGKVATTIVPEGPPHAGWVHDFLALYWWTWRDMLACDFIIVPLLLLCPLLYFKRKNNWLLRAPAALVVYLGAIAFFTAHSVGNVGNAEVRYLAPVLPLCIAISILAVWGLSAMKRGVLIVALMIAAGSMLIEPDGQNNPVLASTAVMYYHELWQPQDEPYTPLLAWMKSHIEPNKSVYIQPDWMTYPVMFRDGDPVYAWQFIDPPKPEYARLPDIHFKDRAAPDYMIAFGPYTKEIGDAQARLAQRGIHYEPVGTIPVYWRAAFRPERNWRTFATQIPKVGEEVYIYQRFDK